MDCAEPNRQWVSREKNFNEQTQPLFFMTEALTYSNSTRMWILHYGDLFILCFETCLLQSARHLSLTNRAWQIVPFECIWKRSSKRWFTLHLCQFFELCWAEDPVLNMLWRFSTFLRRCITTTYSRHCKQGKVAQTTALHWSFCKLVPFFCYCMQCVFHYNWTTLSLSHSKLIILLMLFNICFPLSKENI